MLFRLNFVQFFYTFLNSVLSSRSSSIKICLIAFWYSLSFKSHIGCIQKRNRSLRAQHALAFDWPIFLNLIEYANQIQELTEHLVSGCAFRCTHCHQMQDYFCLCFFYPTFFVTSFTSHILLKNFSRFANYFPIQLYWHCIHSCSYQ